MKVLSKKGTMITMLTILVGVSRIVQGTKFKVKDNLIGVARERFTMYSLFGQVPDFYC